MARIRGRILIPLVQIVEMSLVRSLDVLGAMGVPDTLGINPKSSSPNLASGNSGAPGTSDISGAIGVPDPLGINSKSTGPNFAFGNSGAPGTLETPDAIDAPDALGTNPKPTSSSLKAANPDWSIWADLG